ncbi:MAG: hypothetical protein ACI8P9_003605 [Parasphingorhabdus sp.]|jgi:uncharacterized protein YaeQ
MALKSKVCKFKIALSDMDRNYYDALSLTIAQHPSETTERMMARVVAFCLNAEENLVFSKGLSDTEEPDIWARTLDDQISLWIDIGEPSAERIKKATSLSTIVKVYSFNTKSDVWWELGQKKFKVLNASFFRFKWKDIQQLAELQQRTMNISVTIEDNSAYIATESGECEVSWEPLHVK